MKKYAGKVRLLLLLGAVLAFQADALYTRAAEPVMGTEEPSGEPAAEGAGEELPQEAAAQTEAEAQAAAAAQAEAEAQAAAAAQAEAEAQAAAAAQSEAAAQEAGTDGQAQTGDGQAAEKTPAPQAKKSTSSSGKSSRKKAGNLTEQVKKDIESSLDKDVKDAIMNGYLSLLNKEYILKDELEMDLVGIGGGQELEERSADAIKKLIADAKKEKMYISVTSSYRTYTKQVNLFKTKIRRLESAGYDHEEAVERAARVVAVPGTSEHQLGLTVDFLTRSYRALDEGIRNTKEYRWVEEHAWEYGYVIRYPSGKSGITGIISEPWHLRYVGIPAAKLMTEQGICLEEFLGVAYDGQKDGISYGAGWANTGR